MKLSVLDLMSWQYNSKKSKWKKKLKYELNQILKKKVILWWKVGEKVKKRKRQSSKRPLQKRVGSCEEP